MTINEISKAISDININLLTHAKNLIKETSGKLLILGNGGSSAIASHIAEDFTKNYKPALACSDAAMITCFTNDYGWSSAYETWLHKFCDQDDLVILISSSGQSRNILNCAAWCQLHKVPFITLSGFDSKNPLRRTGSPAIYVESTKYSVVEITHLAFLHIILDELCKEK